MSEIIGHNSNVLFFGGLPLSFIHPTYHVYVLETSHGTVTVNHTDGTSGTLVTITVLPDNGYELDSVTLIGADFVNDNQFYINGQDVYINAVFTEIDYNPLNLPSYTMRLKFTNGFTPVSHVSGAVWTQVSSYPNVWDVTYVNSDWKWLLAGDSDDLLEVLGANTSGVTSMDTLFIQCYSLTKVAIFDTSNVTNMRGMFSRCTSLTTIPRFDTSKVANMNGMLASCPVTTVPFFDTSNVTDVGAMFVGCKSLTGVPLFDTSKATSMSDMFNGCSALISLPQFSTSAASAFSRFCHECSSLSSAPLLDTSNAIYLNDMFNNCVSIKEVPLYATDKAKYVQYMFQGCRNVEQGALALYQQMSTQATPPTNHGSTFKNCGVDTVAGAAELAQIPSGWK